MLVNCAIGMLLFMKAGSYWFDIFNDYAATLSLLLIVLVETVAVCYLYGLSRYSCAKCTHEGHHSQHLSPRGFSNPGEASPVYCRTDTVRLVSNSGKGQVMRNKERARRHDGHHSGGLQALRLLTGRSGRGRAALRAPGAEDGFTGGLTRPSVPAGARRCHPVHSSGLHLRLAPGACPLMATHLWAVALPPWWQPVPFLLPQDPVPRREGPHGHVQHQCPAQKLLGYQRAPWAWTACLQQHPDFLSALQTDLKATSRP